MEISSLLPAAVALLSLLLPRRRAGISLAGGVVLSLGLASLQVAGGADWRAAGLPATYLAVTGALLVLGVLVSMTQAMRSVQRRETTFPVALLVAVGLLVLGLAAWVAVPVVLAGGVIRTVVSAGLIAAVTWVGLAGSGAIGLGQGISRLDQHSFRRTAPGVPRNWDRSDSALLGAHLALALIALLAPHLVLLLLAVLAACITGVLLERRTGGAAGWPWSLTAALLGLALVSGFTISIAGEVPLSLAELREGPFSPAFELLAALGYFLGVWPLLGLVPFHSRRYGVATALAGAALLLRLATPVLSGGTEHWQPLCYPLLVLSAWYAAGLGSTRLAIVAVATAGLISLRPTAAWAGVVLLLGEAAVSTVSRFRPSSLGPALTAGVTVLSLSQLLPLLTGALQAQTFYSVMLAVGLALTLRADVEPPVHSLR